MAATIYTQLTIPLTDFTSLGGNSVNANILKQEFEDAGLTVTVQGVSVSASVVNAQFAGDPTSGDLSAIDAVIAAHTGGDFAATLQRAISEAADSDDTGDEIEKVSLDTGALPAGIYLLGWYLELATTTTTGTSGARGRLQVTKNGGTQTERAQSNAENDQWDPMSGSLSEEVVDGDSYEFALTFERIGVSGNAARAQRGRLTWTRIG